MIVQPLESWHAATSLRDEWNRLAGPLPFRQWEWLGNWWQYYGNEREWFVLVVREESGRIVGIVPWFVEQGTFGHTVQFLGTGETCTDYLSILCDPNRMASVTAALAGWLMETSRADRGSTWDMISLDGVAASDPAVQSLLAHLGQRGCAIHQQHGPNTWRVALPPSWDEYRRQLSKPNRRHVRVVQERLLDTGRVRLQVAESPSEFDRAWSLFVELHQRRRHSLGQAGSFASTAFAQFVRHTADEFFRMGKLELLWAEREQEPMAAQLAFQDGGVTFAYQVGVNPEMLADSPGWIVHTQSIKRAIERGNSAFDFLRGDESHKHRMGAKAQPMMSVRIVPPRLGPAMLHKAWVTGHSVKSWIKAGLEITGMR